MRVVVVVGAAAGVLVGEDEVEAGPYQLYPGKQNGHDIHATRYVTYQPYKAVRT